MTLGLHSGRLRSDRISSNQLDETHTTAVRACELTDDPLDVVQTARVRDDYAEAFRTLHESYLRAGLCEPQPSGMLVKPFHLWPETQIIICRSRGTVCGTMSLVVGESRQLPLEPLFPAEVARERDEHGVVAELSSLAISGTRSDNVHQRFLRLTSFAVEFARRRGARTLLATVHPRHARFYRRAMGFDQIGNVVPHEGVGGKPATLIGVPIDRRESLAELYRKLYFEADFGGNEMLPTSLGGSDREHFARMIVRMPSAVAV